MSKFTGNGVSIVFAAFSTLFLFAAAQAQTFNGPGFTIVDGGGRVAASCSTVPVSGLTGNVAVSSISINNINHSYIGDTQVMVYRPGAAPPPTFGDTISSPPDDRACNFLGTYRYIDSAAQTIDAATAGPCANATNVAPGDYRSSNYFGTTGAGGPPTSLATIFGTLTPAQATGNWLVCVFDYVTTDGGTVGSTSITLSPLTAAGANVGGRVATLNGRGIGSAKMTLTNAAGEIKTAITGPMGYFQFEDVAAGETYILRVSHKRYEFQNATQVINVNENVGDLTFTATND